MVASNVSKAGSYTVLYIGTDPAFITRLYAEHAFVVQHVDNPFRAAGFLNDKAIPDLILCEQELKGMKGIEVFEELKPQLKSRPVFILICNELVHSDVVEAIRFGIDDVLSRTTPVAELKKRMDTTLSGKLLRKQQRAEFRQIVVSRATRLLEKAGALLLLMLSSPLLAGLVAIIRTQSHGKAVFKSKRLNGNLRVVNLYMLRTTFTENEKKIGTLSYLNQYGSENAIIQPEMEACPDCAKLGYNCSPLFTIDGREICENHLSSYKNNHNINGVVPVSDKRRYTPIGMFIRNTWMERLPQLLNVLNGDIALVGSKPLAIYEIENLSPEELEMKRSSKIGFVQWNPAKSRDYSISVEVKPNSAPKELVHSLQV